MRIIAGRYRGRVLKTLSGLKVRPTSSRLREALFDVLGETVEGAVFVDGYAGSGAVGLEALSRGAREVFLLEESAAAHRIILHNLSVLGATPQVTVVRSPVRRALRSLEHRGVQADFCFLDPPYDVPEEAARTLQWLTTTQFLRPTGCIILQHDRKQPQPELPGRWQRVRVLVQGSNALSFYRVAVEDRER